DAFHHGILHEGGVQDPRLTPYHPPDEMGFAREQKDPVSPAREMRRGKAPPGPGWTRPGQYFEAEGVFPTRPLRRSGFHNPILRPFPDLRRPCIAIQIRSERRR